MSVGYLQSVWFMRSQWAHEPDLREWGDFDAMYQMTTDVVSLYLFPIVQAGT